MYGLEKIQQDLCFIATAKSKFEDLHIKTHKLLIQLLIEHKILINCDQELAYSKRLSSTFFPHGLGHMLGLQVHDVGGWQKDEEGSQPNKSTDFPKLRMLRQLRVREVCTIEPGLYFIPLLLDKKRNGKESKYFNWQLIDSLIPFGGIRIEDNIVIGEKDTDNMTREYLGNEITG